MSTTNNEPRFDVDELKLAFAYHVIEEIIGADARIDQGELAFLDGRFPPALLRNCRYVDESGMRTDRYRQALDEAMIELPDRLTVGEKLQLLEIFTAAAAADGAYAMAEGMVLDRAAEYLGLDSTDWRRLVEDSL